MSLKAQKKLLVVVGLIGRLPPHVLPDTPPKKSTTDVSLPYHWAMKSTIEGGFRVYSNSTKVIWLAG